MTEYLLIGMCIAALRCGNEVDRQQIALLRAERRSNAVIIAVGLAVHAALVVLWPLWLAWTLGLAVTAVVRELRR